MERRRHRGCAGHQHQQCRSHASQLVEEGFEATLKRKYNPNSARPRIFDGAAEAKLIALTCSPAPEGFARWSLRLLEEKVVELSIVDKASDNTSDGPKKNELKPHRNRQWVIPPDANAAFVAAMEDVLETSRDRETPIVLSCAWTRPPSD